MFCLTAILNYGRHSLSLGGEMEPSEISWQMLASLLVQINSEFNDHVKHSRLSSRGFSESTWSVAADSFSNLVNVSVIIEVISKIVRVIINLNNLISSSPNISHSHLVHCKCSSLVWADVVSTTHDFTRSKSLNEILVNEHFSDWEGKRNHDCQWKTLWNGHDYNSYSYNQVAEPFLAVVLKRSIIMTLEILNIFATKEIERSTDESFNEKSQK